MPDVLRSESAARYATAMIQETTASAVLDVLRRHLAAADQKCTAAAQSLHAARWDGRAADVKFWQRAHQESLAAWAALRAVLDEVQP
jgi:hypothetical protein